MHSYPRAVQQGTFISLKSVDTLSKFMVNGSLDPQRFLGLISSFTEAAAEATKVEHPRVALCGEGAGLLRVEGKTDATIRVEQLCNIVANTHDVDVLCAYSLSSFQGEEDGREFQSICAEHSRVCSR